MLTLLQLLPPVPALPLVGFVTSQCFTHVAFVRVPSEHDVVVCPAIVDSEYPSSHAGTQNSPVGSAVTAPQLPSSESDPALPLSGFDMTVHVVESAVQTPPVATPPVHTKGASNVNPGLHMGTQDSPFVREVFPSQVPARPLSGGMVKLVHDPGNEQTTFVSVPSLSQLASSVDFSYPSSHVGVHATP